MIKNLFSDILHLLFPETCLTCNNTLTYSEKILCTSCLVDIPRVYFHNCENNPLEDLLWGQIPYVRASSLFYYTKQNAYSQLLYNLKYKNREDIGVYLGELLGVELQKSEFLKDIDCIVPIPLHKKREQKRGYNQSERIAQGISNITNIPVSTNAVSRIKHTQTQTKKSKEERIQNVANIFKVIQTHELQNKHILLVDDVITTGATTISCFETILQAVPSAKVSVASIGLVKV